jgi:hypothetical protein
MKKLTSLFLILFAVALVAASCGSGKATCDAYGSVNNGNTPSDVASK